MKNMAFGNLGTVVPGDFLPNIIFIPADLPRSKNLYMGDLTSLGPKGVRNTTSLLSKAFNFAASAAIGAGAGFAAKTLFLGVAATAGLPASVSIIGASVAAGVARGSISIIKQRANDRKNGVELQPWLSAKTAKTLAFHAVASGIGGSVFYGFHDQIAEAAGKVVHLASKVVENFNTGINFWGALLTNGSHTISLPASINDATLAAFPAHDMANSGLTLASAASGGETVVAPLSAETVAAAPAHISATIPAMRPAPQTISLAGSDSVAGPTALPDPKPEVRFVTGSLQTPAAADIQSPVLSDAPPVSGPAPSAITSAPVGPASEAIEIQTPKQAALAVGRMEAANGRKLSTMARHVLRGAFLGHAQDKTDLANFIFNGKAGFAKNHAMAVGIWKSIVEAGKTHASGGSAYNSAVVNLDYAQYHGLGIVQNKAAAIASLKEIGPNNVRGRALLSQWLGGGHAAAPAHVSYHGMAHHYGAAAAPRGAHAAVAHAVPKAHPGPKVNAGHPVNAATANRIGVNPVFNDGKVGFEVDDSSGKIHLNDRVIVTAPA